MRALCDMVAQGEMRSNLSDSLKALRNNNNVLFIA